MVMCGENKTFIIKTLSKNGLHTSTSFTTRHDNQISFFLYTFFFTFEHQFFV